MPKCLSCNQEFPNFLELALHISKSKTGHRRGKRWAAKYLLLNGKTKRPQTRPNNKPVSQEARDSTRMTLSGKESNELCVCPKCKKGHREMIPAEYMNSEYAWKSQGKPIILCPNCGKTY